MAIVACPECGTEFKENEEFCPECGFPTEKNNAANVEVDCLERLEIVSCNVCKTEYQAKEGNCPKCGYPQLSVSPRIEGYKETVISYRNISDNFVKTELNRAEVSDIVEFGRYE